MRGPGAPASTVINAGQAAAMRDICFRALEAIHRPRRRPAAEQPVAEGWHAQTRRAAYRLSI